MSTKKIISDTGEFALEQMGTAWGSFSLVVLLLFVVVAALCVIIWFQRKDYKEAIAELRAEIAAEREEANHWRTLAYTDKRDSVSLAREQAAEQARSIQTMKEVLEYVRGGP